MSQSKLSRANEGRDYRIFADFGKYLIGKVRPMYADETIPGMDIQNEVFALDSTTVSLSLKLFSWKIFARGDQDPYAIGPSRKHTGLYPD